MIRVNVGSRNALKAEAVGNVFRRVFSERIKIELVDVHSGLPKQPFDEETLQGAIERAKQALKDADYGVGIEGGLISWQVDKLAGLQIKDVTCELVNLQTCELIFSVQFCAIIDQEGEITVGHGSGFVLPPSVIAKLKQGQTLGRVMEGLSGIKEIGKKMGAIGFLSKGLLNRRELTEQAVLMALVPRIRPQLY